MPKPYNEYVDEVACDPAEYASQGNQLHCLTQGESFGLTIVAESAFLSLFAVLYVFAIILMNIVRYAKDHTYDKKFFREPMEVIMLSLFIADFLQALGGVINIKWINTGKLTVGSFCTAQGTIQQLGETGVAITTLTMAIFTFLILRRGTKQGKTRRAGMMFFAVLTIIVAWCFVVLIIGLGFALHQGGKYYMEPTPYWCWIGNPAFNLRFKIAGEYVWFWIALVTSLLLYAILTLWTRGNIKFDDDSLWRMTFFRSRRDNPDDLSFRPRAWTMLAYPLVYSLSILPLSVIRWITFNNANGLGDNRAALTMFVEAVYRLSGFINVVLLIWTRPNTGLFGKFQPAPARGRAPSLGGNSDTDVELSCVEVEARPRMPTMYSDSISERDGRA